MSTTKHFAHVSNELQARYLGTYLGHTDRDGRRYELWRSPAGVLQWLGPAANGELDKLWADPAADKDADHHEALFCLWLYLGQPAPRDGRWFPAAEEAATVMEHTGNLT